jgi:ABC-type sugar transport system permease subunit
VPTQLPGTAAGKPEYRKRGLKPDTPSSARLWFRRWRRPSRRRLFSCLFVAPAAFFLLVFYFLPIVELVRQSFVAGNHPSLYYYRQASGTPEFWQSVAVTCNVVLFTTVIVVPLATCIGALLWKWTAGIRWLSVPFLMPYLTPTVAVAVIWQWIFRPYRGPMNTILSILHIAPLRWLMEPTPVLQLIAPRAANLPPYLRGPSVALCVIILEMVWRCTGLFSLVVCQALHRIPPELRETALLDTANETQVWRGVYLPLLKPTLVLNCLLTVLIASQAFTSIYALTSASEGAPTPGGPIGTTSTLLIYFFNIFYEAPSSPGYAAAVGVAAAIIAVWLGLLVRAMGRVPQDSL